MRKLLLLVVLAACGTARPGGMSGPTLDNHMDDSDPTDTIESTDIMNRDAVTNHSSVKHILISWRDLAPNFQGHQTDRAAKRTAEEAQNLAQDLLKRVRAGEPIEQLMAQFSDDEGSATDGKAYDVAPDANLVFEFKRMGLRLKVGEAGLVKSKFGWHIIKRVQ